MRQQGYVPQGQQQNDQPYQQTPRSARHNKPKKRNKRSLALLISAILGLVFFVLLVSTAFNRADEVLSKTATTAGEAGAQVGTAIGFALLVPQMATTGIAVILNAVGWGARVRGLALAGAILYCVAAVLMIINAPFLVPSIILSFVGYARLAKQKEQP